MKTKFNFLFIAFLVINTFSFSQIKGIVLDENGNTIPYVNISVKAKKIGTVSNPEGLFILSGYDLKKSDSLIFSHLNYKTQTVEVSSNTINIVLKEKSEKLEEVVLTNKKLKIKEKTVGTKVKKELVTLYYTEKLLGSELGKKIEVKPNRIYDIKKIFFDISALGYKSVTYRINFYEIRNEIIQTKKVNLKDEIIKINKTGLVEVDLSNQFLSFEEDFLVAIEWIDYENDPKVLKENKTVDFASKVFSGPDYTRSNIMNKWSTHKVKYNIAVGIYLLVDAYKNP